MCPAKENKTINSGNNLVFIINRKLKILTDIPFELVYYFCTKSVVLAGFPPYCGKPIQLSVPAAMFLPVCNLRYMVVQEDLKMCQKQKSISFDYFFEYEWINDEVLAVTLKKFQRDIIFSSSLLYITVLHILEYEKWLIFKSYSNFVLSNLGKWTRTGKKGERANG